MAAVDAVGADDPHVAGVVVVRGAEPPDGGRAVQVRNTLVFGGRADPKLEVGQLRAIHLEVAAVAGRPANLMTTQQENLAEQPIRTALASATGTTVLAVRDFYLFDRSLFRTAKAVKEIPIQPRVNRAGFVLVYVAVMLLPVAVNILPQQPCPVTACVIQTAVFRDALVDYQILHRRAALHQLYRGTHRKAGGQHPRHRRCMHLALPQK